MNKLKSILDTIVEKYTVGQLRDRTGKFAETGAGNGGGGGSGGKGGGGGGGGGVDYPYQTTATVKRMTVDQFGKDAGKSTHNKQARQIVIGAINGSSGGGSSLSSVYASVSHATGIPQSRALADAVNSHLKNMDRDGQIKVNRETTIMRHGSDAGVKVGKVKWERNADGDWQVSQMETFRISVIDKKLAATGSNIKSPHTLGPRAARFDPKVGGQADEALAFRRKEYSDTRLAPQGRYHSSDRSAPEMMYGDTRAELLEKGKITPKEAAGKVGEPVGGDKNGVGGKYIRKEAFTDRKIDFYDATSSVTAHIGVMTGDRKSLEMSKLLPSKGLPAHHTLATKRLGVSESKSGSPYFSVLSGSKGSLTDADFKGFDEKKASIKEIAKSIWTPGSYGSAPNMAGYSSMGVKVTEGLVKGGMKPELAKQTAQKMLNNFKETSLAKFSKGFTKIIGEAPENFVYENPMSGYRMSFNKHNTEKVYLTLGTNRRSSGSSSSQNEAVKLRADVPTTTNSRKTRSGAAALFVQNWDSAVMSDLMLKQRSPYTVHDAIGVKKSMVGRLNANVAKSMMTAQKYKPLEDLSNQIMKQHEKNGASPTFLAKTRKDLDLAIQQIRKSDEQFTFSAQNNHFALE